jgi:hypothetical protein
VTSGLTYIWRAMICDKSRKQADVARPVSPGLAANSSTVEFEYALLFLVLFAWAFKAILLCAMRVRLDANYQTHDYLQSRHVDEAGTH